MAFAGILARKVPRGWCVGEVSAVTKEVLPGRVDVWVSVLVLMEAAALLAWNFLFTAPAWSVSETGHC